jgi:hypothetical protein
MSPTKGSPLGLAPALPTNNRLGWKGMAVTNTLAYYDTATVIAQIFYSTGLQIESNYYSKGPRKKLIICDCLMPYLMWVGPVL